MANFRFAVGLQRFLPFIGFHHILIILLIISIILYSLVLSGCTSSSSTTSLYLTSLSYQNISHSIAPEQVNPNISATFATLVNGISLEVRTGYFGICASYAGGIWVCSNDAAGLARQFKPEQDPLNLVWASAKFKSGIVFSGLIIAAIALALIVICLLLTFPGWHEEMDEAGSEREVKPYPSRPVSRIALAAATLASLLALVSMMWQHTASVAVATTAQDMGYGTVKSEVGAAAMALGWVALALIIVPSMGLVVMILSINALDSIMDDE